MQTFGDTPFAGNVPEAAKKKIMHAQLPIPETVHLMASDCVEGVGPRLIVGNNFHVSIVAKDKAEAVCTDRFAVQWMVSLPHPA